MAKFEKYTKKNGAVAWSFQVYLGKDENGKEKRTTRRGFPSKKEAQAALLRLQMNVDENGFQEKKSADVFEEYYKMWFVNEYVGNVKESTWVKTQEMFQNHILPKFGKLKIDKISVKYCQLTANEWRDQLAKYRMLKNYVSRVMDYAIKMEDLESNPMKKISMPKRLERIEDEKIENFYTRDELKEFLWHIKNDLSMRWYTFYRLLAFSGFRKGEALALEWRDINFEENTISVTKSIARGKGGKLIVQTPKTKSSRRTIMMDDVTMSILKNWKTEQRQDYLKLGFNTNSPTQLVFSTLKNQHIQPATTTNRLNSIIKKHNLKKITVHGLRHTHCSLLFESGASIQEVKERLGHSDIKTTMNIYAHVTPQAKEKTAERFGNYMNF